MAAHDYLEDLSSLLPAVTLLDKLGYGYLTPSENLALRGGRTSKLILESVLKEQLRKFNSITFKGNQYAFSEGNIQKAVQALADIPFDSLMNTSEQIYDLLTLGKALEQTIDGYTKSFSLHYIDWKNPENNVYHVCDEFVLERRNSKQTRRPDIVLFVNGIPLAVIECKRPDLRDAAEEGVSQHLRNQRTDEIPELFTYAQMLLSVSQNKALYGTTGTPAKFWAIWKEDDKDAQEKILHDLVNEPAGDDFKARLFAERDERQRRTMETLWQSGERLPSPQDKALHSLLRPERLLELIYQYIVFDNKEKKICRYQQYFAVGATLARVGQRKGDSQRPGGVIWHTTGSGKSLTMVMLAKALVLSPDIHNPKIVLVTDRVDLDDQIYKTFHACGKPVVQAKTGEHLLDLITHNKASIITTIIDKFESASRKRKISDESSNIFVLVDESHRSQYGVSHAKMQNVFPNACYIGFTGTPLLKKEKTTAAKFGGFIHKYTMNQAVADGAVTPLLYEGRMSELHGDQAQIDKWFERITKDLTAEQKADLKKKFRREEELSKSEQRMAEIAHESREAARNNPNAQLQGSPSVDELLAADFVSDPLRRHDCAPISDGGVAVVLAAGDRARNWVDRPAWITGLDHRIDSHNFGARSLTSAPSAKLAAEKAGVGNDKIDVAELHAPFTHQHQLLVEALGLGDNVSINPSGGALAANPMMAAGLLRLGEVANRIMAGEVDRGVATATSGHLLQQNLVAVLEGA